jgi:subtilisin family serine protease
MKKIVLILFSIMVIYSAYSQNDSSAYYYYKGNKVLLDKVPKKQFVLLDNGEDSLFLSEKLKNHGFKVSSKIKARDNQHSEKRNSWLILEKQEDLNIKLDTIENILYSAPFFRIKSSDTIGISHLFYVKLKDENDYYLLAQYAEKTKTSIIRQNKFMPLWYTLACSKNSIGNAITTANLFYESAVFAAAHPDIIVEDIAFCTNDVFFNDQWGLNNVGQYGGTAGIDINFCQARNRTQGDNNIIVAVLDHGFELNHPDFGNVSPLSYDTETGTSPQTIVRGSHGTACAGIIGGSSNNNLGITGIAPRTQLMSIANNLSGIDIGSQEELADGINWAVTNNADVISNSWGHNGLSGDIIDDAIENALDNGRNGLGTVLVFASGNDNSNVSYPANSDFDIIAVGAMSPCGERKSPSSCDGENWGSNYSIDDNSIDIIAPGVLIPTTDRQGNNGYNPNQPIHPNVGGNLVANDYAQRDYTVWFNGTSSACPHVAAVAALVLSVNSGLTQHEVGDIIANTAQKVGGYNYQPSGFGGRGTWHREVGHGLVDADAAVREASCNYPIENTTYSSDVTIDGCNDITMTNVAVEDGATVNINNLGNNLLINGTFNAELGTVLNIQP